MWLISKYWWFEEVQISAQYTPTAIKARTGLFLCKNNATCAIRWRIFDDFIYITTGCIRLQQYVLLDRALPIFKIYSTRKHDFAEWIIQYIRTKTYFSSIGIIPALFKNRYVWESGNLFRGKYMVVPTCTNLPELTKRTARKIAPTIAYDRLYIRLPGMKRTNDF